MNTALANYLKKINKLFQSGISTEHSYRADLGHLIGELVPSVDIINEPKKVTDAGSPDYVITAKTKLIGFIEAKDIGIDLHSKNHAEQFTRYKGALDNLIITDYLWFQFFQHGQLIHEIRIGEISGSAIKPLPENYQKFTNLIFEFCDYHGQTISSAKKLAKMMAGKARLLENILNAALTSDEKTKENTSLKQQYQAFKEILIHNLEVKEFADIYAQTLAYGMFAARLHDTKLDTFNRQEAAALIPKSNPFLRKLFQHVAGYDIDERIKLTVDNLAEVFRATDVNELLRDFGKNTGTEDPIIHFYETFLTEYNPELRKSRGVWYTPAPVVNFIVRAVDDILKTEFKLVKGLADTSKTKITVNAQTADKRSASGYKKMEKEFHRVQILDPATGTGTFLAEVVKHIYQKNFKAMQGAWSEYVAEHLIPRLNGFEILMASYAMAHLKLDMLLSETGYQPHTEKRFNVYLTNSLEEHHPDTGTLFASWLSEEANEANHVKRDTPVMVVMGNPPYSGESQNKGEWIMQLMEDYKKEPGGQEKLKERNPKWINDDYVKFLRYGQHFIEKNGSGILAFINPHGFLDNPTFRGMRWNLLKTYDKIYTIDLHGNSKKKETAPDGSIDQNVFDIMQGVSINLFIKTGKKRKDELGRVLHFDLYGERDFKYNFLLEKSISTINYQELPMKAPNYFMVQKDFKTEKKYNKGISLTELFPLNNVGIVTSRDSFVIDEDKNKLEEKIIAFFNLEKEALLNKYSLKENKSWKIDEVKLKAKQFVGSNITPISYRPFDKRFLYNDDCFIERSRTEVMQHFLKGENLGLVTIRRSRSSSNWKEIFISNKIIAGATTISALDINYFFPLYLYPETSGQQTIEETAKRKPNLNQEIVDEIAKKLSLTFTNEKKESKNTFAPLDILDYIYAVLHSPSYREKYKEFLKIDFPRVPYPKDKKKFWQFVKLGGTIRQIHLLEAKKVEKFITKYPIDGSNQITKSIHQKDFQIVNEKKQLGRLWINDSQYFDKIPVVAWEFYIGGYQPAQKWLKDRKGRKLSYEDIVHYQKIIVALTQTDHLMKEIDAVEVE